MDSGLDTGDILCQKELFFDEKKETFATTYDKLLEEMKTLFQENWQAIKDGSMMPVRQVGEGTYHRMRELEAVRERVSFTWNDRIADFKKRYRESGL